MLRLNNDSSRTIDTVFILGLLVMFVATSFLLILIGIKQYNHTTKVLDTNYENRTVSSYLTEKIRQHDSAEGIYVTDLDGHCAIALKAKENDISFTTYIYHYDGALRELVVTDTSVYSLTSGQEIIEISGFEAEMASDSLIRAKVTDSSGNSHTLYFSLHSRKE